VSPAAPEKSPFRWQKYDFIDKNLDKDGRL